MAMGPRIDRLELLNPTSVMAWGVHGWEKHPTWTKVWYEILVVQRAADDSGAVFAWVKDDTSYTPPDPRDWSSIVPVIPDEDMKVTQELRPGNAAAFGVAWATNGGDGTRESLGWSNYNLTIEAGSAS
jgi:hypothetical protein